MNKPSSPRVMWIDALRGAAMVLVVLGHALVGFLNGSAESHAGVVALVLFIYAFHMPVFFFLSGLVSKDHRKAVMPFLKGLGLYVVFPYVLWTVLVVAMQHMVPGGANNPVPWTELAMIGWRPIAIFWFLYVFAVIKLVEFGLTKWLGEREALQTLMLAGVGVGVAFGISGIDARTGVSLGLLDVDVFLLNKLAVCMAFYALGRMVALRGTADVMAAVMRWPLAVRLGGSAAGMLILVAFALGIQGMPNLLEPLWEFQRPILLTGLVGIASGVLLFASVQTFKPVMGGLALVGAFSMVIYVQHIFYSAGVRFVLNKVGIGMLPVGIMVIVGAGIILPIIWQKVADRLGITPLFGIRKVQ